MLISMNVLRDHMTVQLIQIALTRRVTMLVIVLTDGQWMEPMTIKIVLILMSVTQMSTIVTCYTASVLILLVVSTVNVMLGFKELDSKEHEFRNVGHC